VDDVVGVGLLARWKEGLSFVVAGGSYMTNASGA
jgi:hypothetical protein